RTSEEADSAGPDCSWWSGCLAEGPVRPGRAGPVDRGDHGRLIAVPSAGLPGAQADDQVTEAPPVTLVCCGVIGTTVSDNGMVERAYSEAIATQGVVTGTSAYARSMAGVHRSRGQYTLDVMRSLFPENQPRAQAAQL